MGVGRTKTMLDAMKCRTVRRNDCCKEKIDSNENNFSMSPDLEQSQKEEEKNKEES